MHEAISMVYFVWSSFITVGSGQKVKRWINFKEKEVREIRRVDFRELVLTFTITISLGIL